jgi:transcriptional regulator with XRE-family HTH domain
MRTSGGSKPAVDPPALNESASARHLTLLEITPEQIRAARALLRLDRAELAERARLSVVTIRRLETARGSRRVAPACLARVRKVLEEAGAEFIPDAVRRRCAAGTDARDLYADLRAISLRSAAQLQGRELLTDADLYDEDGLPA